MRKVEPLARALEGKAAWLTGLRRDEAPTRANAPIVGCDVGRGIVKVNPIASWTHDEIDGYVADRGLPQHPLREKGYPSIGCWPCTQAGGGRRRPARRPVGRQRQARVRPPRLDTVGCHLSVHEVASSGFGAEADAYERARPSYPPDAVDWLVGALGTRPTAVGRRRRGRAPASSPGCSCRAYRRGAGRGRTGRPACAALLAAPLPDVAVTAATAEALPFADGVARRHHRRAGVPLVRRAPPRSREFHRVLRPGGRLALVWNARDRSVPWVDEVWSIMDRVEKRAPWRAHDEWRESAFVETPWFGPLHEATFRHEQLLSPADVVERVRSVSHVAVLPAEQQEAVLDEVRALLARRSRDGRTRRGRAPLPGRRVLDREELM